MVVSLNQDSLEEDPGRERLLGLVRELCERYGWNWRGRPRTAAMLSVLMSGACERLVGFRLSHPEDRDRTKFDPYYAEKSRLGTTVILDYLKGSLESAGYSVGMAMEARDLNGTGTYDVVIDATGNPCVVLRGGEPVVRLELKGSLGLDLTQVSRYLLNPTPLVLVRIRLGQVVLLRPSDLKEYVDFQASLLVSKAERLLRGQGHAIPGPQCQGCPDQACPYREPGRATGPRLVTMREVEFAEDISAYFRNIPSVCRRTSELVVQELASAKAGPA